MMDVFEVAMRRLSIGFGDAWVGPLGIRGGLIATAALLGSRIGASSPNLSSMSAARLGSTGVHTTDSSTVLLGWGVALPVRLLG